MANVNKYNPLEEGVNHLNIYSKSNNELGRFLTNFAHCRIDTEDGTFESIEGYWSWLGISEENTKVREQLRKACGVNAKKLKQDAFNNGDPGRFDERFEEKIKAAIEIKINSEMGNQILSRNRYLLTLPIVHYYYFGKPENCKVIDVTDAYKFFVDAVKDSIDKWLNTH